LRVLVINTVPFIRDGTSTVIMDYYRVLRSKVSFDFVVNTEITQDLKDEIISNNSAIYFIKSRKKNPLNYFLQLRKILRNHNYDVIHIHGNSALMSIELLSIKDKDKTIVHGHNVSTDYPLLNRLLKPYFKKNFQIGIVPTVEAGNFLFEKGQNFQIIPNGIDLKKYVFNPVAREKIRTSFQFKDEKVIICVGNFNKQKYQELLISIFPKLLEKGVYYVLFVGAGEKQEQLLKLAREKGVENQVKFVGSVSDVQNYYSASDIFVLPTHFESFGIVAVEAQINGLPCIVSDCIPRIINQTENLYFAPNDNWDLWLDLILKASRKIPKSDISLFDIAKSGEKIFQIYESFGEKR